MFSSKRDLFWMEESNLQRVVRVLGRRRAWCDRYKDQKLSEKNMILYIYKSYLILYSITTNINYLEYGSKVQIKVNINNFRHWGSTLEGKPPVKILISIHSTKLLCVLLFYDCVNGKQVDKMNLDSDGETILIKTDRYGGDGSPDDVKNCWIEKVERLEQTFSVIRNTIRMRRAQKNSVFPEKFSNFVPQSLDVELGQFEAKRRRNPARQKCCATSHSFGNQIRKNSSSATGHILEPFALQLLKWI